jgi:hypothetical protein
MDTSLELIREKIGELEEKLANLRIAEREIQALEKSSVHKEKTPPRKEKTPHTEVTKTVVPASEEPGTPQTIVAAITGTLSQHGPLSAANIAEQIMATGKEVNNRAISFSLQALKKRGVVKNTDGVWTLLKGRAKRARA